MQGRREAGECDGAGRRCVLLDECDMHCPVRAWWLAELTSAVDWVDDPDAFGGESGRVVGAFFRKHCVVGSASGQQLHEQNVALAIAFVFQLVRGAAGRCKLGSDGEEELACLRGDVGCELVVVGRCHETGSIACHQAGDCVRRCDVADIEMISDTHAALDQCGDLFRADPVGSNMVAAALSPTVDFELWRVAEAGRTVGAAFRAGPTCMLSEMTTIAALCIADELPIEQVAKRWIVASDPDEAVEKVKQYTDAGLNHLVFHAPGHDQKRFLELFEKDLAPRLRALG